MPDTKLRSLEEVMQHLIVPIPEWFIKTKPDSSHAEYIDITTRKDLLDWACGFGRWEAVVKSTVGPIQTAYQKKDRNGNLEPPVIGSMFGMVLTLRIHTSDGIFEQDGTGTEMLTGSPVYGDALTNAYAQALGRAAESFGQARELWRRKVHPAQEEALRSINGEVTNAPMVDDDPQGDADEMMVIETEIMHIYCAMDKKDKGEKAVGKLQGKSISEYRIALKAVQEMYAKIEEAF